MLIITTFEDCDVLVKALNLGARGYVLKNIELEELISAIKQVVSGERVLQSAVTDFLLKSKSAPSAQLNGQRTNRIAVFVFRYAKQSDCQKQITQRTIRNHVSQILAKLDVKDRTQAVIKPLIKT